MKTNTHIIICLFFLFISGNICAQVSLFEANTAAERLSAVQSLVGEGIQILNLTVDCGTDGFGTYSNTGDNLGFENGIVLTSGTLENILPSTGIDSGTTNNGSDPQLDALSGFTTLDKCVVEFDLIPAGDNVDFLYVWGSFEYLNFTCSRYNDVFGFFISGPNPSGGDYVNENIALVPGSNLPVAIGTINNGTGMDGTPCTDFATQNLCPCNSQYFVSNEIQQDIAYYGFTKVLTAHFDAIPCETYHLKLAVADATDAILDSGIFLGSGTLHSPGINIIAYTGFENEGFNGAIEGCLDGYFDMHFDFEINTDLSLSYTIGGTAIPGVDFIISGPGLNTANQTLFIPAETDMLTLHVEALADGNIESIEEIIITIENISSCFSIPFTSDTLTIVDEFKINPLMPLQEICPGEITTLGVIANLAGNMTFSWDPAEYVVNPTAGFTPTLNNITQNTNFTCTVTLGACMGTTVVEVVVKPQPHFQDETYSVCSGESISLDRYSNLPGYIVGWNPVTGLSDPSSATPTFTAGSASNQVFTVNFISIDPAVCNKTFTVTIQSLVPGSLNAGPDVFDCESLSGIIGPEPVAGFQYLWSPAEGLSDPTIAQPTVLLTANATTNSRIYTLTVTDANGCSDTDEVMVTAYAPPPLDAGVEVFLFAGQETHFIATGAISYVWSPEIWLSDAHIANPTISPDNNEAASYTYYVTGTDENGCEAIDSVLLTISRISSLQIPTAFSPNSDGNNDLLMIHATDVTQILDWKIFNRWGDMVFDANGDINASWDGNKNGVQQDLGVYVYVIKYQGLVASDVKVVKGNVTLLR